MLTTLLWCSHQSGHPSWCLPLTLSPHGRRASATWDSTVRLPSGWRAKLPGVTQRPMTDISAWSASTYQGMPVDRGAAAIGAGPGSPYASATRNLRTTWFTCCSAAMVSRWRQRSPPAPAPASKCPRPVLRRQRGPASARVVGLRGLLGRSLAVLARRAGVAPAVLSQLPWWCRSPARGA